MKNEKNTSIKKYEEKIQEARKWLNSSKGSKKLSANLNAAKKFTDQLQKNRQVSMETMKEIVNL